MVQMTRTVVTTTVRKVSSVLPTRGLLSNCLDVAVQTVVNAIKSVYTVTSWGSRALGGVLGFNRFDTLGAFTPVLFNLCVQAPLTILQHAVFRPVAEEVFTRLTGPILGPIILTVGDVLANVPMINRMDAPWDEKVKVVAESTLMVFSLHISTAHVPLWLACCAHVGFNLAMLERQIRCQLLLVDDGLAILSPFLDLFSDRAVVLGSSQLVELMGKLALEAAWVKDFDDYWYTDHATTFTEDDNVALVPIPEANRIVSAQNSSCTKTVEVDTSIKVSMVTPFSTEDPPSGCYWRIYGVSTPMFKPAKTAHNMNQLLKYRLTRAIKYRARAGIFFAILKDWMEAQMQWPCENSCLSSYTFVDVKFDIIEQIVNRPSLRAALFGPWSGVQQREGIWSDIKEKFEAWLPHTDPQKWPRYRAAFEQIADDALEVWRKIVKAVQVNVKCDEVLLKPDWVPRPIDAVHPHLAVAAGIEVYFAAEQIKLWASPAYLGRTKGLAGPLDIYFTYGAARDARYLSQWFQHAVETNGHHIITAGDDSVVVIRDGERLVLIETDVSQNDHSNRLPVLAFEWFLLTIFGADEHAVRLLMHNARAPRVLAMDHEKGSCVIHREAERNTGGVDTTVGNTLASAAAHYVYAQRHKVMFWGFSHPFATDARDIDKAFANCGLEAKSRVQFGFTSDLFQTMMPPSFLKGTWYQFEGEMGDSELKVAWSYLPSRFIKVSKIMSDPFRVYRLPGEKKQDLTYELVANRHMVAVAKGLLPFVTDYRIERWLRSFLANPAADSIKATLEEWSEQHRPAPSLLIGRCVTYIKQCSVWYSVDPEEFLQWVQHLTSIQPGMFSFHPMWEIMARRDYC